MKYTPTLYSNTPRHTMSTEDPEEPQWVPLSQLDPYLFAMYLEVLIGSSVLHYSAGSDQNES